MECNEFGRLMFDGKIVYCKDGDGLIPYWQGVTEEGLEKFVRDYAERGTEGFADFMPNITPHVCRHYVECLIMVSLSQKTSIQAS